MRILPLLILFLLGCAVQTAAAADISLSVARISTSHGATLSRWDPVYLDIAYTGDQPLRFQAEAYRGGESAKGAMNGAPVYPAGSGHALVWVSFFEPAAIDEIRVTAYDEAFEPLTVLSVPFRARWSGEAAARRAEPPAWVSRLREKENALEAAYRLAHPPEPDPVGDLIVTFMFFAVPGYFIFQAGSLFFMRGGWRRAALVPLVVMVPAAVLTGLAMAAGSNLGPIYLVFTAPVGFLYLAALLAARGIRSLAA